MIFDIRINSKKDLTKEDVFATIDSVVLNNDSIFAYATISGNIFGLLPKAVYTLDGYRVVYYSRPDSTIIENKQYLA